MAKYKQSETVTIQRSVIFFAPYNPRKENKHVVDELKRNFKKVGYLGGIVWNQNTGNLVGGHKRVQALDLIHEYDGSIDKDYELKVEMINVDEKTEKEQNIFLNNRRVQGETDYELLSSMLSDIDIENTGLDERDIDVIKTIIPDFNFGNNEQILNDAELLKTDYNERKEKIKELKKTSKKEYQKTK